MALSVEQQDIFRARLTQERARIQADLSSLDAEVATLGKDQQTEGGSTGNHMADGATDIAEQDRDMALIGTLQERQREVDQALERLQQGSYGVCERCGKPIPAERLEVRPFSILCVDCQSKVERQRQPSLV